MQTKEKKTNAKNKSPKLGSKLQVFRSECNYILSVTMFNDLTPPSPNLKKCIMLN